jgi:hypothetical protein
MFHVTIYSDLALPYSIFDSPNNRIHITKSRFYLDVKESIWATPIQNLVSSRPLKDHGYAAKHFSHPPLETLLSDYHSNDVRTSTLRPTRHASVGMAGV